jgi:hypothetical protein
MKTNPNLHLILLNDTLKKKNLGGHPLGIKFLEKENLAATLYLSHKKTQNKTKKPSHLTTSLVELWPFTSPFQPPKASS